jgi:2-polyprenyl-6-methoxyphenol hydroxylase-like FAD-dependent oxidoreductase
VKPFKPITIAGGGIGGLSLGIGLRQRSVDVQLLEAGAYPRHRVCGEFISGKGWQIIQSLGLEKALLDAGAVEARTFKCYGPDRISQVLPLPSPALCLSRFRMDAYMADEFVKLGGKLFTQKSADPSMSDQAEGLVWAKGRQPASSRKYGWIGFKCHVTAYPLQADLEMHFGNDGYVGLCRVEHDKINVCGLKRMDEKLETLTPQKRCTQWALASMHESRKRDLQESTVLEETICYTAGLSYRNQATSSAKAWIGDQRTRIPPFTGNGMSMALESAQIAVEPIHAYATGNLTWPIACQKMGLMMRKQFRARVAFANLFQHLLMTDGPLNPKNVLIKHLPWIYPHLYRWTR